MTHPEAGAAGTVRPDEIRRDFPFAIGHTFTGENAMLFHPGDEDALAGAVGALLADPSLADRIATHARRDAENYTCQKRARRILDSIARGELSR
jgi:glycosyltransferase involved in cell wall biosynthesis